jgi:TRAP-type C4-dicarboxylate transport system permease small subunit
MKQSDTKENRFGLRDLFLVLFLLACFGGLGWPGYRWFGARIEPMVYGIPFSLAWVTGWVVIAFLGLLLYDATRKR